jgi:hypothetical protein
MQTRLPRCHKVATTFRFDKLSSSPHSHTQTIHLGLLLIYHPPQLTVSCQPRSQPHRQRRHDPDAAAERSTASRNSFFGEASYLAGGAPIAGKKFEIGPKSSEGCSRRVTYQKHHCSARQSQRIAQREASQPSPFFSLPAELRNWILNYACRGIGLQFWHANTRVGAAYGSLIKNEGDYTWDHLEYIDRLQPGLPSWMLLSKQMLAESLQQFQQIATFFQVNDDDNPLGNKA